jgi:hypothetical protein
VDTRQRRSALKAMVAVPLGLAGLASVARAATSKTASQAPTVEMLVAQLDVLNSRAEITDVLFRYARGWDRLDEEALRSCFWPDSMHQHGGFTGKSQDFLTAGLKVVGALPRPTTHMITNFTIDIVGDRAVSECYFRSHHRRKKKTGDGQEDWMLNGRYLDRFERREGVWKIAFRRGLHDFAHTFDPADTSLDSAPPDQLSGLKPEDPLYGMLSALHEGH